MRFFTESEETTRVRFYFTDKPFLPIVHRFGTDNWLTEGEDNGFEQIIGTAHKWVNGARVGSAPGDHYCGTEEQWRYGQPLPGPAVTVLDDGTPVCCFGSLAETVFLGSGGQAQGYDNRNTVGSGGQRQGGRGTFSPFLGSGGQQQGGSASPVQVATGGQQQGGSGVWPWFSTDAQVQGGSGVWPHPAVGGQWQGGAGLFSSVVGGATGQQQGGLGTWALTGTGGQVQGGEGGTAQAGTGGQVQGSSGLFVVIGSGGEQQGGNGGSVPTGIGGQMQGGSGQSVSTGIGGQWQGGFGQAVSPGTGGQFQGGAGEFQEVAISGEIISFAGSTTPTGFLVCDGAAVSRSTFATLFGVIGTTFGAGDGSTTFNVPNLAGRFPIGTGVLSTDTYNRGDVGGEARHMQTAAEVAIHHHAFAIIPFTLAAGSFAARVATAGGSASTFDTEPAGGISPMENRPPFLALRFLIKT